MENIVFEMDYEEEHKRRAAEDESSTATAIFDRAINSNFLKAYSDTMDAIPKIIVPEDKANYGVSSQVKYTLFRQQMHTFSQPVFSW